MERIVRLSEQFKSTLEEHPDTRMLCWLGASASEYRMIKGFVMFHLSEESTLDDIFILCSQPFNSDTAEAYGQETCKLMKQYVDTWNGDDRLTSQTGMIAWVPEYDDKQSDAANFAANINQLAKSFSCSEEQKLVVALMPQRIDELKLFGKWVENVLKQPIDNTVCFMLYDSWHERLFDSLNNDYESRFIFIQPDLDLYDAVNQILENSKQANTDKQEQDIAGFQQLLIKLSLAVSRQDEKEAADCAGKAVDLARKYELHHLEALVYYFLFNLYSSLDKDRKAEEYIDRTLLHARKAVDAKTEGSALAFCQYLTAKGNTFLFKRKYGKAIPWYSEAMNLAKDCSESLYINMCQMLGLCYRKEGNTDAAYDCLIEGWKRIETMETDEIRKQQILCYYALELGKVLKGDEEYRYEMRFEEIWGENWKDSLKQQHKEHKASFHALSVKK
jgi:tetratricopeptide (TPR) repeat protein